MRKITTRLELAKKCVRWRQEKRIVGYTSGSFDLLHEGHVSYLAEARKKCDILLVGLNSDSSIKRYKDDKRPIIGEEARLKVLQALESVSYVFLFDELNNAINITRLKPDLYIKASDYQKKKSYFCASSGKMGWQSIDSSFTNGFFDY